MTDRKTFTENEICKKYETLSINAIAREYHISDKTVKEILLKNNVTLRNPQKKIKNDGWDYSHELQKKYPPKDGFHYVAISKDGKVIYEDYMNKSGVLTNYIKNNLNIAIPSLYKRTKFFKDNGYQWYEQWFEITLKENVKQPTKKCPYCEWETVDVENKSGMYLTHILKEHGYTKEQHLMLHPEDKEFLSLKNKTLNRLYETDETKFVKCCICGKKLARIDWRHLIHHGITKEEYIEKYGNNIVSKEFSKYLSIQATEVNKNLEITKSSKSEKEIGDFIKQHNVDIITGDRKILGNGKEIDIYIPSQKIAIEFDGIRFHSEFGPNKVGHLYHLEKTNLCKEKGIKLIHIFEDEFTYRKDIVFNKIAHILKFQTQLPRVMGRQCTIKEITKNESQPFLEKYHIQGFVDSSIHLGAFYNKQLIAVMLFKKESKISTNWELTRFASTYEYVCQGIGGKLFKYFIRNYNPSKIKSFADRRWTIDEENNVYLQLGFKFDSYTKPSYSYIIKKIDKCKRFHKFGFRKQKLAKKYGFPLTMTETEMAKALGYDRIWDCGLIKYVWKK